MSIFYVTKDAERATGIDLDDFMRWQEDNL